MLNWLCILLAFILQYNPAEGSQCACASIATDILAAPVPNGLTGIIGRLQSASCLPYAGEMKATDEGNIWAHVNFNGREGWVNTNAVYMRDCQHTDFSCVCALTTTAIRSSHAGLHRPIGSLNGQSCLLLPGHSTSSSGSYTKVIYRHQVALVDTDHVSFHYDCSNSPPAPATSSLQLPGCPHIISRAEWNARDPSSPPISLPARPQYMFIHHGATAGCHTRPECIRLIQSYQNYHMDGHGWDDIGYSFVVGEDGNVYEGRGWDTQGAHTRGYNTVGLGVCTIGNFMTQAPNQAALDAVTQLISCAVNNGKIVSDYTLLGHRDVGTTACPGDKYYKVIQQWPHFNCTRQ